MPKIPMSNKAGAVQYQRSTVPLTNVPRIAPVVNHDAEALVNFGKEISNAGGRIFDAASGVVSARNKFFQQQQYTEDRLAATEARNLYRTINADLESRMAENPNDYEKFKEWAQEADKRYADGAREFTGKMSADFRKQFEAEMSGIRVENLGRRTRIGIQAKVTADYNLFQSQWKDAALRGDLQECNRMLEEQRGNLISENEYQQKKLDYERLAAFGVVKRAVEGNVPGIIGKLKERNPEGGYVNFPGLEESARDRFIRVAEARDAQRRSDENAALVDQLSSGENITLESIDKKFESDPSPEAQRQRMQQRQIVQRFLNTRAGYKAKATARQREDETNAFEYKLLAFDFATEDALRQKQYADLRNEIFTKYAGDGATVKRLMRQLDDSFNAKIKPDSSYKQSYIYLKANAMLEDMKKDFWALERMEDRSFWNSNKEDDSVLLSSNYKMAKIHLDHFIRQNPSATESDVRTFLDNLKRDVNRSECDKLVQFWAHRSTPRIQNSSINSGEVERMVNGRIAIFGKDKKFIRWKDGK